METWLRELRSPSGEGPIRGASRQVGAGFKLLRRDRTILVLSLIGALWMTAIWIGIFYLDRGSGPLTRDGDRIFRQMLFGAGAFGASLLLSLGVACAADARIDDSPGGIRLVLGEVRERLPVLAGWWAISMAAWFALRLAADAVLSPLLAYLAPTALWGVGSFFVVPALVIEPGGLFAALALGLRLLLARWGRTLIGLLLLVCFYFVAFIPVMKLLRAGEDRYPLDHGSGLWLYFAGIALFYLVGSITIAAREGFAVILARDALGDLPGDPAPPKPRRRARVVTKRIVIGVVGLTILLVVLGAILRHRSNSAEPSGATPPPGARFYTGFTSPRAFRLESGAPVRIGVTRIGTVYTTAVEEQPAGEPAIVRVDYRVEPPWVRVAIKRQLVVAESDEFAYLLYRRRPQRSR